MRLFRLVILTTLLAILLTTALTTVADAKPCRQCFKETCLGCGYADGSFALPFCTRPDSFLGTVTLDIVALERSGPDSQDVLFAGVNPVANADQFNFDVEAGLRFDLIMPSDCGCDLNINLFGTGDYQNSVTRNDAGITFVFFGGGPANPVAAYTMEYVSDLFSAEINARTREWSRFSTIAGFRYVNLEEEFNIFEAGTTTGFRSDTDNRLYGLQLGGQALLWERCRWRIESLGKAGVYFNDISTHVQAADALGNALVSDRSFHHAAFVGELQLTVYYQVGPRMQLRCGYQGLWLGGVALAPDQSDNGILGIDQLSLDAGKANYHGGFLGLEVTW